MSDADSIEERMNRHQAEIEAATGNAPGKHEFAAALREVLDELASSGAPDDFLRSEAERVRELAAELRRHPAPPAEGASVLTGMENFHDRSPIVGLANPIAPPAVLEHFPDEQSVRGTCEFSKAFEGGPGLVHGGFLAALLDEALGVVTVYSGSAGMTGEYTLRYHAPTRIKVPLRLEARYDSRDGRKLYVSADLWDGETLTVHATGTFIAVDDAKFEAFAAARSEHVEAS